MSEPHDQPVLYRATDGTLADLHFDPSPAEALPQLTFPVSYELQANHETLALQHFAPAHTDSDIYVHFQKGQRDSKWATRFSTACIPYIDPGTGGNIDGMIAAGRHHSLARRRLHQDRCWARPARQQSGPHESPGYAHHFARIAFRN